MSLPLLVARRPRRIRSCWTAGVTACRPDFAPQDEIDDSERALLWDIQNRETASYGKKIVDVNFLGSDESEGMPGKLKMDVSEVGKNVASMGRMLRAGFDLHFTNMGHDCWMERDGRRWRCCRCLRSGRTSRRRTVALLRRFRHLRQRMLCTLACWCSWPA